MAEERTIDPLNVPIPRGAEGGITINVWRDALKNFAGQPPRLDLSDAITEADHEESAVLEEVHTRTSSGRAGAAASPPPQPSEVCILRLIAERGINNRSFRRVVSRLLSDKKHGRHSESARRFFSAIELDAFVVNWGGFAPPGVVVEEPECSSKVVESRAATRTRANLDIWLTAVGAARSSGLSGIDAARFVMDRVTGRRESVSQTTNSGLLADEQRVAQARSEMSEVVQGIERNLGRRHKPGRDQRVRDYLEPEAELGYLARYVGAYTDLWSMIRCHPRLVGAVNDAAPLVSIGAGPFLDLAGWCQPSGWSGPKLAVDPWKWNTARGHPGWRRVVEWLCGNIQEVAGYVPGPAPPPQLAEARLHPSPFPPSDIPRGSVVLLSYMLNHLSAGRDSAPNRVDPDQCERMRTWLADVVNRDCTVVVADFSGRRTQSRLRAAFWDVLGDIRWSSRARGRCWELDDGPPTLVVVYERGVRGGHWRELEQVGREHAAVVNPSTGKAGAKLSVADISETAKQTAMEFDLTGIDRTRFVMDQIGSANA